MLGFVLVVPSQVGGSFWHRGRLSLLTPTMDSSPGGAILRASVYRRFLCLDVGKTLQHGSREGAGRSGFVWGEQRDGYNVAIKLLVWKGGVAGSAGIAAFPSAVRF